MLQNKETNIRQKADKNIQLKVPKASLSLSLVIFLRLEKASECLIHFPKALLYQSDTVRATHPEVQKIKLLQQKEALWKHTDRLLRVVSVILMFKLVAGTRSHFIYTCKY